MDLFDRRVRLIKEKPETKTEFEQEMRRFLPTEEVEKTLGKEGFWEFLVYLTEDLGNQIRKNGAGPVW